MAANAVIITTVMRTGSRLRSRTNVQAMPTIRRFARCKIMMHFNEHPPPHFHVIAVDGEAKFRIDTLELIAGEIDPRDAYEALAWAEENHDLLFAKWMEICEEEGDL